MSGSGVVMKKPTLSALKKRPALLACMVTNFVWISMPDNNNEYFHAFDYWKVSKLDHEIFVNDEDIELIGWL